MIDDREEEFVQKRLLPAFRFMQSDFLNERCQPASVVAVLHERFKIRKAKFRLKCFGRQNFKAILLQYLNNFLFAVGTDHTLKVWGTAAEEQLEQRMPGSAL